MSNWHARSKVRSISSRKRRMRHARQQGGFWKEASFPGLLTWIGRLVLPADSLTWLSFSPSGPACPFLLEYFLVGYALSEQELCCNFNFSCWDWLRGFVCLCGFARLSCVGSPRFFPVMLVCCFARFRIYAPSSFLLQ